MALPATIRALFSLSGVGAAAAVGAGVVAKSQGIDPAQVDAVVALVSGYLINRASGRPEIVEQSAAKARNHHLKRGFAAAIRTALASAPDYIRNENAAAFVLWDNMLERALDRDNALLDQMLQGEELEQAWKASNQFLPREEAALELTVLLEEWLQSARASYWDFPPQLQPYAQQAITLSESFRRYFGTSFADAYQRDFRKMVVQDDLGYLDRAFQVRALHQLLDLATDSNQGIKELLRRSAERAVPPPPFPLLVPGELPPVVPLTMPHRMPHGSLGSRFIARVAELWETHRNLKKGQVAAAVSGTGGLGKTQLAIEYVHRFGREYPGGVYWVDAEGGPQQIVGQLAGPTGIEVDGRLPERQQLERFWQALAAKGNGHSVLVVLDNFTEQAKLSDYKPTESAIRLLLTTRRKGLPGSSQVLLKFLEEQEALALLNSGERQHTLAEDKPLLDRLAGLPMALELVRGYVEKNPHVPLTAVVAGIAKQRDLPALKTFGTKYEDQLPSGHTLDIAATFEWSWQLIQTDAARQLLQAMSVLAPEAVPLHVLARWEPLQGTLHDGIVESPVIDGARNELQQLSLVDVDPEGETAGWPRAHRLLLGFVREAHPPAAKEHEAVGNLFEAEMSRAYDAADTASFRQLENVWRHAESLVSDEALEAKLRCELTNNLGRHHGNLGRYQMAKSASESCLGLAIANYPANDPAITRSQSNLAMVLQDLGQYKEAAQLLRKALAAVEASYQPGNLAIARSQSNLARVLQNLGQYEEAAQLLHKALAAGKASYAPGHPSVATRQSNLALVLRDLGRYDEAAQLLRRALTADETNYQPGHPCIAMSQSSLATVLQALGQYEEAAQLLRKALAADQASYQPGHPSITRHQSNLALVLKDLGQYEEAAQLLRIALATDQASYQPGHPSISRSQSNLALVLKALGQYEEAAQLLRIALAADEASYQPGHPTIGIRQWSLGMVLKDLHQPKSGSSLAHPTLHFPARC